MPLLPLESLSYEVEVVGPLADVVIRQRFANASTSFLDATYLYPLDPDAILDGMVFRVGDRVITSQIRERQEARAVFEQAKERGQVAALASEVASSLFAQEISNIPPWTSVEVELSFVGQVRETDGGWELVLPLVSPPRLETAGLYRNREQITSTDALREQIGVPVDIHVAVHADTDLSDMGSPTHPAEVAISGREARTSVLNARPDRDFVLRWFPVPRVTTALSVWIGDDQAMLEIHPPELAIADFAMREVVWVAPQNPLGPLGQQVEQARDAVRGTLGVLDVFREDASLEAALKRPRDPGRHRTIVVAGHGAFADDAGLLRSVASMPWLTVHAIGLGAVPNRGWYEELARAGGGSAVFVYDGDGGADAADRIAAALQAPLLTDVRVDWGDCPGDQVSPQRIPDVVSGRPQRVLAHVASCFGPVWVSGESNGRRAEWAVWPEYVAEGRALAVAWARARVADLERRHLYGPAGDPSAEIREIGLRWGVVTSQTSFVGVDPEVRNVTGERIAATQPLYSEGWSVQDDDPGGYAIEVVAVGRRAVDVSSTSSGQVLTREFLQRVPAGRSYQQAVQTAAGVTGGANPNMAGGAHNENTYMLDGATITDPVTGTFSLNFNFDAIAQIEVLLGGYMPEFGTSPGGVVNIVTMSGTNNLEFNVSAYYTNGQLSPKMDERYTSDGFLLAPTGADQDFQSIEVSGLLSGPLVRDKAWFLASYSGVRSLIGSAGVAVPRDFDSHALFFKATVQPTEEHRFTALLQLDPTVIDNGIQSPFTLPEAQNRQSQGGFITSEKWQWFLSPDAELATTATVQQRYLNVAPVPCTHDRDLGYSPCRPDEADGSQDWESPGHVGLSGAFDSVNYGTYSFDDRDTYRASSRLSLLNVRDPFDGTHDFKFGVEGAQFVWSLLQGYTGNSLYVDTNQTFSDPNSLEGYYWFETTGPLAFRTKGSQLSAFAQDSYTPLGNVTINYGSRVDSFTLRNNLGEAVIDGLQFGPRLFGAWDPFRDQKTKIAGGFGRFNDIGTLDVAGFTSADTIGSKVFLGENILGAADGALNVADHMYDLTPRENTNVAHENLRTPRVDEWLLTLEREVISDLALFTNASFKATRHLYEYDTTNVTYDSDGSTVIGSRNDSPSVPIYRLRTPLLAKRDYVQWDVGIRKVESRRWANTVTYTYTQSRGTSAERTSGSFSRDPQTQFNEGPFLDTDLTHVIKTSGFWDLPTDPWTQSIGWYAQYQSGLPLERLYFAEYEGGGVGDPYNLRIQPRGTYARATPQWFINLQFSQQINVRKGKFQFTVACDNITNNQAPGSLQTEALYSENRLFAADRQLPRQFVFGAEYNF